MQTFLFLVFCVFVNSGSFIQENSTSSTFDVSLTKELTQTTEQNIVTDDTNSNNEGFVLNNSSTVTENTTLGRHIEKSKPLSKDVTDHIDILPDLNTRETNASKITMYAFSDTSNATGLTTDELNVHNSTNVNKTSINGVTNVDTTVLKSTSTQNYSSEKSTTTKSSLTLEQIELLGRHFKTILNTGTSAQRTELNDLLPEDEPFGSAIWKDQKYMISVMIPIGVGITGAMIIMVMAYASKICKKGTEEDPTPSIPRIITQPSATGSKPDDIMLLKDSSDEEF